MVQLVVNHESGCYQVIVVLENGGRLFEKARYVAMVYDSATGAWSSSSNSLSSCIFGNRVYVDRYPVEDGNRLGGLRGLCAFDGAKDEFLDLDAFPVDPHVKLTQNMPSPVTLLWATVSLCCTRNREAESHMFAFWSIKRRRASPTG
jgi:hypothetical protein